MFVSKNNFPKHTGHRVLISSNIKTFEKIYWLKYIENRLPTYFFNYEILKTCTYVKY